MMSDIWKFKDGVSEEEIRQAQSDLTDAIKDIDTPEEWMRLTKKIMLKVGKIAISHLPIAGIALDVLEEVFDDNEDIMRILERILEEKNND
jgi:hypothetical protein